MSQETKLEVRLRSPRFPSWVLVVLAGVCWVLGLEHRLDHDGDEPEEKGP